MEMAMPFRVDSRGGVVAVSDPAAVVEQHLVTFVATSPGERVMRPTYGTPLREALFANFNSVEAELLRQRITKAAALGVPEAVIDSMAVDVTEDETGSSIRFGVRFGVNLGGGSTTSTTDTGFSVALS